MILEKKVLPWKAGLDREFANILTSSRHKALGVECSGRRIGKSRRKGDEKMRESTNSRLASYLGPWMWLCIIMITYS